MFVREGILDPLSTSILSTMRDEEADPDDSCARAIGILLLFSQVAQADSRVRDAFANRSVMIRESWPPAHLPRILTFLLQDCSKLVLLYRATSSSLLSRPSSTSPHHLS